MNALVIIRHRNYIFCIRIFHLFSDKSAERLLQETETCQRYTGFTFIIRILELTRTMSVDLNNYNNRNVYNNEKSYNNYTTKVKIAMVMIILIMTGPLVLITTVITVQFLRFLCFLARRSA